MCWPATWPTPTCGAHYSTVLWIYSLSRVNLSYAYPMVALGYVLVCVFSVLLFKETMPTLRIAGLGVIILGVIMIAISA